MISTLKLYASALVLAAWAALWAAGVRGDAVITIALTVLTIAVVIAERERQRRRADSRR